MPDHVEDGTTHNPLYQWACAADGCRGILIWLPGQGQSVCCVCGKNWKRNEGLLYDISGDEPRLLSDDEVAELRGS